MNVSEASRARHLLIHLDRGDDLPEALLRALTEREARAAWITGTGSLESAELSLLDPQGREQRRYLDTPSTVTSLSGNAAIEAGVLSVHLAVTLARETDQGLVLAGGALLAGRPRSLDLLVTVFDDLQLQRLPGENGRGGLTGKKVGSVLTPEPRALEPRPEPRAPEPRAPEPRAPELRSAAPVVIPAARGSEPQAAPPAFQAGASAALPLKPAKPKDDFDGVYPEPGDLVTHFTFGECSVVGSDGDRISLRPTPDGRVLTVALSVLKIEPQPDGPDGQRRFKLSRKN
jgi:predicted DNA-binding protein with PD1-like motif